ncbi:redoxin domain-containing protein [candidate division KSB1 bacterium]|nr:redoxin domain-containing protein [candidate division KSB1 bacterium]
MHPAETYKRLLFGGIAVLVVMTLGAGVIINWAHRSVTRIPVIGNVPQFSFQAHDGEKFGYVDFWGHYTLVDFIFTNCQSACPIMTSEMSKLYEKYSYSDQLQFVSVSVDPARDTLPVLQDYAEKQGVDDDRWHFLRAPVDSVIWLSEKGFYLPAENLPMGHSSKLVLVDKKNRIRGYYDALDEQEMEILQHDLKRLARQ